MREKICVYTCITGDYDNLREVTKPERGVDYYCFTNNKNLKSKTWKIVQIENEGLDNQRLSRKIKMLGEPSVFKKYEISVWMDASVVWDKSIVEFVEKYLNEGMFAAFVHSQRSSVRDEAVACLRLRKDTKDSILETLEFLKNEGFVDKIGLYEMTVFAKRHKDVVVRKAMELWFEMVQKHSKRDQLSFPYAVWKTGLKIEPVNLNVWDNEWFHTVKHRQNRKVEDCHVYFGNPDEDFDFDRYFIYDYKQKNGTFFFQTTIPFDVGEIEFNFAEAMGARLTHIEITPKPKSLIYHGVEDVREEKIICTNHDVVRVFGEFHKGENLLFSVELEWLDELELLSLIENFWLSERMVTQKSYSLEDENKRLKGELEQIKNSRAWKLVSSAGKIIHRS